MNLNLQSGDLVKFRQAGEERFGTFDRYGRDATALIQISGETVRARVQPLDIIENRSEQWRQLQAAGAAGGAGAVTAGTSPVGDRGSREGGHDR